MSTAKTLEDFGIHIDAGETRTLCPQCSPHRTKSYDKCLAVDQEKGVWFCHHCGFSGGLGGTKEEHEEAKRIFSEPHFVSTEIADEKVLSWFASRGISKQALAAFNIKSGQAWMHGKNGGGNTNTIQFPFYYGGKVVNIKYRTGDKRFRQEKNAQKCFFGHDQAMRSTSDMLLITEGEMDTLALYEAGFRAVVSVPDGAPSPDTKAYATKFDFLEGAECLFEKFKNVVLAVDNDAPGKKLENELSRRIGIDRCMRVVWPEGCKDANDVLVKHGKEALHRCIDEATFYPVDGVKSVEDLWYSVFDLHCTPERAGVETGWKNAEGVFNVETGQMTIVTGIPSHGKSTFIDALRVNLFRLHGWSSAAFSPENWPAQNHLAILSQMYANRNFYEQTEDELYGVMQKLLPAFFFIQPESDQEMMNVDAILTRARALVYRNGIKVLVIDPWNEIEHSIPSGQREDQYISVQLAKIRRFARVNAVHIFVIAHPRQLEKDKNGSYPPPTAYDIAGGAMWRNKADNILCVYRPSMETSETEVYVQKIRFRRNGNAGSVMKFSYNVSTSTYYEKADV
jgi:twinkle protein